MLWSKMHFLPKIGRRQRVGADKKSEDKSFSSAFSPEGTLLKRTKMKKEDWGGLRADNSSYFFKQNRLQSWQYGKGLIYYGPIFSASLI